jgi:hypothetical protein
MKLNLLNKTILIKFNSRKPWYSAKLYNEPYGYLFVWYKLSIQIYPKGQETYTDDNADCDICSHCGEHSSMEFDIETGESLGTECCGASHHDVDYSPYDR